jgi:hypothetical protein
MLPKRYEGFAQFEYDFIRIRQPQLEVDGLFQIDDHFFVLCKNLNDDSVAMDGSSVKKWVSENRIVTLSISLVNQIPLGAQPVPERSHLDYVNFVGKPRTIQTLQTDLEVLLPKSFPNFLIKAERGELLIVTENVLSDEEKTIIINLIESFKNPILSIRFTQGSFEEIVSQGDTSKRLTLSSARNIRNHFTRDLVNLYESDEDYWISNRDSILTDKKDPLKYSFATQDKSRCIIDATSFPPRNARIYLSIYEVLILALPLNETYENFLQEFGISEDDLIELIRLGKIEPILPQNLKRYPRRLIEKIAELDSAKTIMPRRLLMHVLSDGRHRYPLLYPTFGISERREVLKILYTEISELPEGSEKTVLIAFLRAISENWTDWENDVSLGGIFSTLRTGLGNLGSRLYTANTGQDLQIELMGTASLVEWASALHATAFPFTSSDYDGVKKGYSNANAAAFLSSVYTGIPIQLNSTDYVGKVDVAVREILAVSNDEPILNFVESLGRGDIARLGKLINDISNHASSKEEVETVTQDFNKMIRSYSSRTSVLDSFEIMGIIDLVPSLIGGQIPSYIPGGALIWRLLNKEVENKKGDDALIGSIFDSINAVLRLSNPHAVLIHRIRTRRSLNFFERIFKR